MQFCIRSGIPKNTCYRAWRGTRPWRRIVVKLQKYTQGFVTLEMYGYATKKPKKGIEK